MKNYLSSEHCYCGKAHNATIDEIIIEKGAVQRLPEMIKKYSSKKPFILADLNTYEVAGKYVADILNREHIPYSEYIFKDKSLEPDEKAVGSAVMHFDTSCDLIIGVGSGVINDIGKIISNISQRKYFIVGTAPSMDGYASSTSSMSLDGLKVSVPSRCADVIIGDIDILKNAPEQMLKAGLGDMLAKYISIAEWRISNIVTGEYYCEQVAQLIRSALKKCVDNAQGVMKREEAAIQAVFEGLVISGVAMAYAGVSRPASGIEHYFSPVWDMRGLEFGTRVDLHGIQCAVATMKTVELYEKIKSVSPDRQKAYTAVAAFDYDNWSEQLRSFLGKSGETMILQEQKEKKYDETTHPERFQKICDNWDEILKIIQEEIPSEFTLGQILDTIGIPLELSALGVDTQCAQLTFKATKDIRDKYILSRLAWDLGVLDELADTLST